MKELGTDGRRRAAAIRAAASLVLLALFLAFPVAAQAVSYSTEELAFLRLINDYRQQNGLSKLLLSDMVSDAGEKHSRDMGKYRFFSHNTVQSDTYPAGSTPWYRMAQSGYSYSTGKAENIAAGYSTAAGVFNGWKNSAGHNANMLNGTFKVIGIGLEYVSGSPYGWYWTTDFGAYADPSARDPLSTTTTLAPGTTTPGPTTTTLRPTTTTVRPTTTTVRPTTTTVRPTTTTLATGRPAAPANLVVTGTGYTTVGLRWQDMSLNERGFYLERSTNNLYWLRVRALGPLAGSGGYVNYTDPYRARGTTYFYRVRAYNAYGVSAVSNTVTARTN